MPVVIYFDAEGEDELTLLYDYTADSVYVTLVDGEEKLGSGHLQVGDFEMVERGEGHTSSTSLGVEGKPGYQTLELSIWPQSKVFKSKGRSLLLSEDNWKDLYGRLRAFKAEADRIARELQDGAREPPSE